MLSVETAQIPSSEKVVHVPTPAENYASLTTNNKAYLNSNYPPQKTDPGFPGVRDDFHWDTTTDEPHRTRRKVIIGKYPEIKALMGHCWKTKYSTVGLVVAQFGMAYYLLDKMWTMEYWVLSYLFGATMTHSLFLAIHEISHFLAFKAPLHNRLLAIVANLPIGIPYCAAFRGYHMEHHTLQGSEGVDTDLPTHIEGVLLGSTLGKLFFSVRPMFVRAQTFTFWHFANWTVQLSAMAVMIYNFGMNPFYYFLTCTVLSGSLHPMAGHFLAEHFVFVEGFETYSYYGPLNMYDWVANLRLGFNVGYHNEHHDFPRIPGSRLPMVRKIAAEFYDDLPQVKSWPGTIYNFIMFPHMSPFSRVKRAMKKKVE